MGATDPASFGVVAIARNEGERLKRCLASLPAQACVVYVDSGSTDGSLQWARARGANVVELDTSRGFTAARARNAGLARLRALKPELAFVQFVDGDCELDAGWPELAIAFLKAHPRAGVVFGRRRERDPDASIYNALLDHEWDGAPGEVRACGGDAMMRIEAVAAAGCYRDDMIAGEEPELCVRLRAAGWSIWRIEAWMTLHDAAMSRFSQWWRRQVRTGYAFALGASLHGAAPERMWVWESRRALIWGLLVPALCAGAVAAFGLAGLASLMIYPLQLVRRIRHFPGSLSQRLRFAGLEQLGRFAEALGQLKFRRDRMRGLSGAAIEYK